MLDERNAATRAGVLRGARARLASTTMASARNIRVPVNDGIHLMPRRRPEKASAPHGYRSGFRSCFQHGSNTVPFNRYHESPSMRAFFDRLALAAASGW